MEEELRALPWLQKPAIERCLVVKVGTSSLTHTSGYIALEKLDALMRQLVELKHSGVHVVLVSSGAIGAGMGRLKVDKSTATLPQKQALAAVGQNLLMSMYHKFAAEYGVDVGQILLTREDLEDAARSAHSKNALRALLGYGVIPIINENDAVAVEEIKFGDNDRLSAMVARLLEADGLIILTDTEGLYDRNPNDGPGAQLLSHIKALKPEHISAATGSASPLGTGGMATKLMAVDIAGAAGVDTIIANGSSPGVLLKAFRGACIGTWFEGRRFEGRRDDEKGTDVC